MQGVKGAEAQRLRAGLTLSVSIPPSLPPSLPFPALAPPACQVGSQPALEALPLILEPESRMYSSPVVVLDFQSLYPSLIIAYNLCYTTCIGRPLHAKACR